MIWLEGDLMNWAKCIKWSNIFIFCISSFFFLLTISLFNGLWVIGTICSEVLKWNTPVLHSLSLYYLLIISYHLSFLQFWLKKLGSLYINNWLVNRSRWTSFIKIIVLCIPWDSEHSPVNEMDGHLQKFIYCFSFIPPLPSLLNNPNQVLFAAGFLHEYFNFIELLVEWSMTSCYYHFISRE